MIAVVEGREQGAVVLIPVVERENVVGIGVFAAAETREGAEEVPVDAFGGFGTPGKEGRNGVEGVAGPVVDAEVEGGDGAAGVVFVSGDAAERGDPGGRGFAVALQEQGGDGAPADSLLCIAAALVEGCEQGAGALIAVVEGVSRVPLF